MAEAIVSLVVERLEDLLLEKITLLRGVRKQFERLQKELASIIWFLKTVDSNHNQDQDIRNWVADVRDIAYDVDDIIDAFLFKVASKEEEGSNNVLKRYAHMPKKLFNFNNIGKEINKIFAKIVEISDRRKRYGITSVVQIERVNSSPSSEMLLRRVYPHTNDDDTIGLEDQTNTFVAELLKEDDRLCVVSIHGMGGLGKSTLAKKVYNHPKVKSHFANCRAWAFISQTWNTAAVLQEILRKVNTLTSKDIVKMKEVELFEELTEILQTKRYLVVLDDIWSKEAWDALKPAFPNNKGSKVMFTTRNLEVAKHADRWSFHLEQRSLTNDEAWVLLCRKAFPPNDNSSLLCNFEKCGRNIVKKCGGFPLQVVVLGGILASKGTLDEWETVSQQIGTQTSHGQGDGVFSILYLSYNELPYYLKPLFLYLGLFPEDFLISVKKLVRMWMAESLIREEKEGETIEEVGTRYLDELIHRSMVQIGEKSMGGKRIKTCRLHDNMRELCITIGREENFFKAINENGDSSSSSCLARTTNKLRRIAIYIGKEGEQYVFPKKFTRCVRTAYFIQVDHFFDFQRFILKKFKLLKVLDFGGCVVDENKFVREVEKLSNLRYLCMGAYLGRIDILLKSFKNLVCLQTLDLRQISFWMEPIPQIPNTMNQLRHVYAIHCIYISNVNTMAKLQTLYKVLAGPWIADLVELTNLEKLGIGELDEATMGLLTIAIGGGGLDKLRSLYLDYDEENGFSLDLLEALFAKRRLQKLKLHGTINKLPSKISSNLIKLTFGVSFLSEDPMPTLEKLQHLLFLNFNRDSYKGNEMVCSANGFPKLQRLKISYLSKLVELIVEKGAMPCLMTCEIHNCRWLKTVPQGFKFLTMLHELKITMMPKSFEQRVKEGGEDWETIKHIQSIIVKG